MESREFSARTVDEALTKATVELGVTSDKLDYEVIEKGSSGFLGIGSKEAVIRVSLHSESSKDTAPEASTDISQESAEADHSEPSVLNLTEDDDAQDNSSDDWIPYNPIPDQEDLDFTEEAHRLLSREVAIQTMVLATNNGELPLEETDQVVLFGIGTENTIYGGWGSGEVYNKGTTQSLKPVTILEGIENAKDNFIYRENKIGYEIGLPESNLTEADVEKFAEKDEKAQRSVAILTISRRSGEGSDRPQDQSNVGTLLSDTEINTYNALIKYFDKVVVVLNVGSVIELNDIEKNEKTSILISFLPGM